MPEPSRPGTHAGQDSQSEFARSGVSSIFLRRKVGAMFLRVNSKCAHQVRPPLRADSGVKGGTQLSLNTTRQGKTTRSNRVNLSCSARLRRLPFRPRDGPSRGSRYPTSQPRRRPARSTNEARMSRQEDLGPRQMPARAWPLQRVDRSVATAASTPSHRQDRRTPPRTDYSKRR
jgi:hypothetical protein